MIMESGDELYVSIGRPVYRGGKAKVLGSQESLLKIMKIFANLKVLWKEKKRLRTVVSKMLSEAVSDINSANASMPVPKAILRKIEKEKEMKEKIARRKVEEKLSMAEMAKRKADSRSKSRVIEDELKEIQEKLKSLNA